MTYRFERDEDPEDFRCWGCELNLPPGWIRQMGHYCLKCREEVDDAEDDME